MMKQSASTTSSENKKKSKKISYYFQKVAAVLLVVGFASYIVFNAKPDPKYSLVLKNNSILLRALWTTLWISIVSLILSMFFGLFFYLGMKAKNTFLRTITNTLKETIMGTPLLVLIFIVFYVFAPKLNFHSRLGLGIAALTIYMVPYIANTYETSISVIDRDQFTVMELYHFNLFQKYVYVIIPQMIRPMIPAMLNNLSTIIKGSALLNLIAVLEITYQIQVIANDTYATVEAYIVMWILYLIVTVPLSLIAGALGRRVSHES